jgi:eukaryotic-like serine/threonine-protein kinase
MAFSAGTRVGPYDIRSQLGAGGMGEVYRAHDPRLGRDIALKVIRRALVVDGTGGRCDNDVIHRLLREATLASSPEHRHHSRNGVVDDDRYIAMELVEGSTLRQIASESVPFERALGIARQVAEALAVAHAAQIVHRDIKPENVMVRPDGYPKLLDFDLARLHETAVTAAPTRPG